MKDEFEILYDIQLNAELEKLIQNAKKHLFLVSPYIDLDPKIKDAIKTHQDKPEFKLSILFGKADSEYCNSFKKESFEFLSAFPNIDIRYNERLHAKYYENDFDYIITSMNLYNYSLANNIEIGLKGFKSSKGLLSQAVDKPFELLIQGIDAIKTEVVGMEIGKTPSAKFLEIFKGSTMVYKTEPKYKQATSMQTFLGNKALDGYEVVLNCFGGRLKQVKKITKAQNNSSDTNTSKLQYLSATKYGERLNVDNSTVHIYMKSEGLISDPKTITGKGFEAGLKMMKHNGIDYVGYPLGIIDEAVIRNIQ
jgi:hypothetical protein